MFDVLGQLGALKRYARSLVRNPMDAEDLVHDTLVRAYERRLSFRRGANLRNWLLSILHNTHVDRVRSSSSRMRRETAVNAETETSYSAHQEHGVRLAQIRAAFDKLPEDQREALHLIAIEDMSYQQAAELLDVPVGTLMSRVSRARSALRDFENTAKTPPHLRIVGGSND